MKNLSMIARILLGLMLVVFGLNKFMHFIPMEMPTEGPVFNYFMALSSVHLMDIVGVLELICGVMLLLNKYVVLAAVIVAAIMLNALLFHLTLDPAGSGGAIAGTILTLVVLYSQKEKLSTLFSA